MGYTATSFSFGEQPSASKWNQLGANDAEFNSLIGHNASGNSIRHDIPYQQITSNSVQDNVLFQFGVSFINNDGTEASTKAITFPEAFTTVLAVFMTLNSEKSASDPTSVTDTSGTGMSDSVQLTCLASGVTTSGFTAVVKRTAASSGVRAVFSWMAVGVKA